MSVKLGFIPIKRAIFDPQAPIDQKYAVEKTLRALTPPEVEVVDCGDLAPDGLIYELDKIQPVVSKMKAAGVDGLFLPHCNFGSEEIAVRIARQLKVPVLLWGGRDVRPVPGEIRLQDTQCGLFATSRGLQNANIPFSYIVNCHLTEERFSKGFLEFLSVISVVRAFRKKMRILQIGSRPRPFFTVMYNEAELFHKFGIEVVPQPFFDVADRVNSRIRENGAAFREELRELTARVDCSRLPEEHVKILTALIHVVETLAQENTCAGVACECWTLFPQTIGIRPCFVNGELTARGLPVSCETDVLGAVSSVLLQAAALDTRPTFFADITIRHPDNDNAELLWHCGPFPHALRAPESHAFINALGKGNWRIQGGDITVCRLDGVGGDYKLLVGQGRGCDGPETEGSYIWFETDNWPRWEEKLILGPYIHHISGLHGQWGKALAEAVKYLPGVTLDAMEAFGASLGT